MRQSRDKNGKTVRKLFQKAKILPTRNVDVNESAGIPSIAREMITFRVGTQEFCVDVMSIREIRGWTPVTPIAHAPKFMVGVVDLRGKVLPIIDFAVRLGFAATAPTSRHAILVVELGEQIVGLLVEGVSEILSINPEDIQPTPDLYGQPKVATVSGIIARDGRMISLVDLQSIVPIEPQAAAA